MGGTKVLRKKMAPPSYFIDTHMVKFFSDESQICVGGSNRVSVRKMATWFSSTTKWLQVQYHGVGVLVFSRCMNIRRSWREYKFRKIYWHLKYKSLAGYCIFQMVVTFFNMITPLYIGLVSHKNTSPETELKLEILWAMLTKWYPPLPHVLYGKVLVLLWETPKLFE